MKNIIKKIKISVKNYIFLSSNSKSYILETVYLYTNVLFYFCFKDVTSLINIYFYLWFFLQI